MTYLLIFFISLLSTIFLTPYIISLLERSGVTDRPGERKVHEGIKPRMGGIVIFIVVFTQLFIFYPDISSIRFLLLGMIVISICGSLDDMLGVKWNVKFFLQSIAVVLLLFYFLPQIDSFSIFTFSIPYWLGIIIFFLLLLGTVNAVNLMDGMDGLVSGYSLITFSILFLLAGNIGDFFLLVIISALAGSLLGYLKFNGFPARVFLGDLGSLFLGYLLIALTSEVSLVYFQSMELAFPVLLLSIPILDTIKVMLRRIAHKKHPFLPDNEHLHHVIFHSRIRQKTVVFLILIYNLFFIGIALYFLKLRSIEILIIYFPFAVVVFIAKYFFEKYKENNFIQPVLEKITELPAKVFNLTYKIFVPITTVLVLLVLIIFFPVKTLINNGDLLLLLLLGFITLFVALYHRRYNHRFIVNVYFFFNITIYLILGSYPHSIFSPTILVDFQLDSILLSVSIVSIFAFIGLFVIGRERILPKEKLFLSGIDLTLIVFVVGAFIFEKMFPSLKLFSIPDAIFLSFGFYLWFKIIHMFDPKFSNVIFYTSFLIPIATLSYLVLTT